MTLTDHDNNLIRAAHAARVPDSDRNGPMAESITLSGWYEAPTVSGRLAWVHMAWIDGHARETCCTYDLAAERALSARGL